MLLKNLNAFALMTLVIAYDIHSWTEIRVQLLQELSGYAKFLKCLLELER